MKLNEHNEYKMLTTQVSKCCVGRDWMWDFGPIRFQCGRGYPTHTRQQHISCIQVMPE